MIVTDRFVSWAAGSPFRGTFVDETQIALQRFIGPQALVQNRYTDNSKELNIYIYGDVQDYS